MRPYLAFLSILVLFFDTLSTVSSTCSCTSRHISLSALSPSWTIFSPEYPRPYCGNLDCTWIITGPQNSTIRFHIKKTDLRRRRDQIRFYDDNEIEERIHEVFPKKERRGARNHCTGREECEFVTTSGRLGVRFVTGRGVPDNFGFQGTVTLYIDDIHQVLDGSINESSLTSAWNFIVWIILVICALAFILAVVYLACLKKTQEGNRSPLLAKHLPEESVHMSVNSLMDTPDSV